MAALAMAIFLRGMDRGEIARWTDAMIRSGARMDFSGIGKPTADKHSTGGVGDKITLPLAPLVACFGVAVPQLSGRGLGHTGGTLDKLEAIPGWRAPLSNDEIMTQLGQGCGAVICAAGSGLAPADQLHHEQEDRRGHGSPRPRCQGRVGCLHEGPGRCARARPHDGRPRTRRGGRHARPPHRHVRAAGTKDRQRPGGGGIRRGPRGWRPLRRRRADVRARAQHARWTAGAR